MEESDTYLAIREEGEKMAVRRVILTQGEDRIGPANEFVKANLDQITDLERLMRMVRRTPKAASWQEIVDTP